MVFNAADKRRVWPKAVLADVHTVLPQALERFESGKPKIIIPEKLRAQEGRALCLYGDAGWGQEVARGKYGSGSFNDALVTAAAEMIQRKWKPCSFSLLGLNIPSQDITFRNPTRKRRESSYPSFRLLVQE